MNYKKLYNTIIENRKNNPISGYTENHHILPRSLGGTDDKENLVNLTAREHFICHYLLAKMHEKESFEWYKMNHAFMMMKLESSIQNRYFNSRLYEALKINFSSVMSKSQSGTGNSQYGKMWICNIELKENKKIDKTTEIPYGWIKGRNKWNGIKECPTCKCFFNDTNRTYCSKQCTPKHFKGSQLDGREQEFLSLYEEYNSINKSLKVMGFVGAGKYYYWAKKILN